MEIWTRLRDWVSQTDSFRLRGSTREQRDFIQRYEFPAGLRVRFEREHPQLSLSEREQVFQALRQYFLICHNLNGAMAAMPSQIVDDAWHSFILFTREYSEFCRRAFGRYLHHTPVEAMSTPTQAPDVIKRTWRTACRLEKINPLYPTTLPIIFAIDANLNIANGFIYHLDCMRSGAHIAPNGSRNDYCAMHIGCGGGGCSGGVGDSGCSDSGCSDSGCGDSGSSCSSSSCGGASCGASSCGGGSCGGGGCGGN